MEYCRRLKPRASLGHRCPRVPPTELRSVRPLEEWNIENFDYERVWKEDDKTPIYTSKNGISVAFEKETGTVKGFISTLSLPQVLIARRLFYLPKTLEKKTTIIIRSHDSDKPETIANFNGFYWPEIYIQGSQVFFILKRKYSIFDDSIAKKEETYILYFNMESEQSMVFRYKLLVERPNDWIFFDCYDGLFYEFQDNGKHRISQANSAGLVANQDGRTARRHYFTRMAGRS